MKEFYKLPAKCCGNCRFYKPYKKNMKVGDCRRVTVNNSTFVENDMGEYCEYFDKKPQTQFF